MKDYIKINEKDNVGVSLSGDESYPAGHKFALEDIALGEHVIKYGEIIGRATKEIKKGEWVHTHNLKTQLDEKAEYSYNFSAVDFPMKQGDFMGYRRLNGKVGVRNDIYIIPTVGCVNNVCREIEERARSLISGSIDGVFALTHQFGCSQLGSDGENIKKLLASVALNPNASFVLFVGLGCENNSLDGIKKELVPENAQNIASYNCQDVENDVEYGLNIIKEFVSKAKDYKRERVSIGELCIGVKCGGSDGFSGITANPLVGKISDRIVSYGGSVVLTEVPEMFGAEQLLMNKCASKEVYSRFKSMIENFKSYYTENGFAVYENPSPGNKEGGITTLEEKSLGCVQKAGATKINDVLDYAERVKFKGVSVLNSPGNDLIASTALAAAGCQIVLFTTGRGTPFSTFVPTMKISTNNTLAKTKDAWIDFNAYSMDEDAFFARLIETVEGRIKCKSEKHKEIAFYKTGVIL